MTQRRTTPTPGGTRRPGRRGGTSRARVAAASPEEAGTTGSTRRVAAPLRTVASQPPQGARPRFTSRAAILLIVMLVLGVSYASSLQAYLDQRATIEATKAEIAASEKAIADLEREKRRWQDEAFVKAQARQHLGYLMPGETGYQVLDENGEPLAPVAGLRDPDEVIKEQPTPWWDEVWSSVELAGNPPPERPDAPRVIDGVKQSKQEKQ